jgi:outer membrane protein insertion porin family
VVRFGVPVTAHDTINYGLGYERTKLTVFDDSPQRFLDYVETFGEDNDTILGTIGWARDGRDSLLYPTSGTLQRLSVELGLPGGSLQYYKTSYQYQRYFPLGRNYSLLLNGEIGVGDGLADKPLPFFKNFFAGGVTSVRGYRSNSLGPKDQNDDPIGGSRRVVLNGEFLFPFPGLANERSVRLSAFVDAGMIAEKFKTDEFRYSAGLGVLWVSPLGPLKISVAQPLNDKPEDKVQRVQFTFGTSF